MCNDTARIRTIFLWRAALQGDRLIAATALIYSYINVRVNEHVPTRFVQVCKHACDAVSASSVVPREFLLRSHVAAASGSSCGAGLGSAPARFRACTELSGLAAELAACAPRTALQAAQEGYWHALNSGGRATGSLPHETLIQETIKSWCCMRLNPSTHVP